MFRLNGSPDWRSTFGVLNLAPYHWNEFDQWGYVFKADQWIGWWSRVTIRFGWMSGSGEYWCRVNIGFGWISVSGEYRVRVNIGFRWISVSGEYRVRVNIGVGRLSELGEYLVLVIGFGWIPESGEQESFMARLLGTSACSLSYFKHPRVSGVGKGSPNDAPMPRVALGVFGGGARLACSRFVSPPTAPRAGFIINPCPLVTIVRCA